jgi:hypothetical protein
MWAILVVLYVGGAYSTWEFLRETQMAVGRWRNVLVCSIWPITQGVLGLFLLYVRFDIRRRRR